MKDKMIVTGGKGYIASLIKLFSTTYDVKLIDKEELDLSDLEKVSDYFNNEDYSIVLHAGAIPDTKTCELYPEFTHRVNVQSTKTIADICKRRDKRLIFISSEQIFNGLNVSGPHYENTSVNSVTIYGNHKIECEKYLESIDLDYIILRFSWMFGMSFPGIKPSYNIISIVLNAMSYDEPTKFTVNELRGFTYAHNFAKQFDKISKLPKGIYNVSADNNLNTYEVAKLIARLMGFNSEKITRNIIPNLERYKDRFRDFHMSSDKLRKMNIIFSDLETELKECLNDFGWLNYDQK